MKHRVNKFIKSAAAALLCAVMLASSAGCDSGDPSYAEREQLIEELYGAVELEGTEQSTGGDATTSNFTLAYFKDDTVNPYLCTSTLNATLGDLIYDQLITVNSEFEAEMVIAQKVEYTGNRAITVTLRDGIVFSDGTLLTGADIQYSFNAARQTATDKKPGSRYANALSVFQNCTYSGNKVYFRLNDPDPRAYMLLDFPIIKAESDKDGKTPIGSGRYIFISDVLTGTYLLRNEKWYSTNVSDVRRVSLTSMPTVESIVNSVEIGTISYYYTDLRDGYPTRLNANYTTVDINNLVYLGVNTAHPVLEYTTVRKSLSAALNREDIITAAYAGRAYAATGPLTTSWPVAAIAQSGSTLNSTETAVNGLVGEGFVNEDGYVRYNEQGQRLEFRLIVNKDNEMQCTVAEQIADQAKDAGIGIIVEPVTYTRLVERIAAGEYELYLAEYSLLNNMDFSRLFTPNEGLYYGLTPQQTMDAWKSYINGVVTIDKVIQCFESEQPFIPVCYRLGIACYSRSLDAKMNISESDPFWGMQDWSVALAQ